MKRLRKIGCDQPLARIGVLFSTTPRGGSSLISAEERPSRTMALLESVASRIKSVEWNGTASADAIALSAL